MFNKWWVRTDAPNNQMSMDLPFAAFALKVGDEIMGLLNQEMQLDLDAAHKMVNP